MSSVIGNLINGGAPIVSAADLRYDYSQLAPDAAATVQASAIDIKTREKRAARDIVEIGRQLISVQDALPHGEFLNWVQTEFGWKKSAAYNFIGVARKFPKFGNLDNIGLSAIYELTSADDSVVADALELADAGEQVTYTKVKEMKQQAKARAVYVAPEPEPTQPPPARQRPAYMEPRAGFVPAIMRQVENYVSPAPDASTAYDVRTVDQVLPFEPELDTNGSGQEKTRALPSGKLLFEFTPDVAGELLTVIRQGGLNFLMRKSSVAALESALSEVIE